MDEIHQYLASTSLSGMKQVASVTQLEPQAAVFDVALMASAVQICLSESLLPLCMHCARRSSALPHRHLPAPPAALQC